MPARPVKVAVLGGGPAAVTTAFELTDPALEGRFEVTVYQPGWRLGGKCASGRNLSPGGQARIEEHGLHVWFGFYDNAFNVMRRAYEELDRPPGHPLRTLEDAFKGCDEVVLYDRQGDGWIDLTFAAPPNEQIPGGAYPLPGFWDIARWMTDWALQRYGEVKAEHPQAFKEVPPGPPAQSHWDMASLAAALGRTERSVGEHQLLHAHVLARAAQATGTELLPRRLAGHLGALEAKLARAPERLLAELLCGFRDWLWVAVVEGRVERDPHLRLFFTILDTFVSAAAGIVEDGVLERGWEAINQYDLCEWLARHGAKPVTLGAIPSERSPVLRSIYDVAFGYPEGKIEQADIAAGTAMNDLLRLVFTYRGSLFYKMQAGMGDTVLGPFYLALRKRGVKFEFFTAVTGLGLEQGRERVERIEIVRQVELRKTGGDAPYEPLVEVRGLECWPSAPLWDQLVEGEVLAGQGHDFEGELNPLGREGETLRRGQDFDEVVLAIPVGALGGICPELAERSPRFAEMLAHSATVTTQAFQLWLARAPTELGYEHPESSVAGCYAEPLDTWCDMTHLLGREQWGAAAGVGGIAYFCGVLDERAGETPAAARARVKENAEQFLRAQAGPIWPKAVTSPGGPLDWSLLAAPVGAPSGPARFATQYWRANVTPPERYVLTPSGSVSHRLAPGESGFENLILAGDWTRNGIDGGCVEAAVTSGLLAAQALLGGGPPPSGTNARWLAERHTGAPAQPPRGPGAAPRPPAGRPRAAGPRYVEYGGRATAPPPFRSLGGVFRGLLLEGDGALIAGLIDRVLNVPAAGRVVYRPLFAKHVLLQTGAFAEVSSEAPGFAQWGSVNETQISLWVPVLAGHLDGHLFVAERLCMAVPYILVDNPMSYAGGREDYGYPKTMGIFDPPEGVGDPLTVKAFGGQFEPTSKAGWHELIKITRRGAGKAAAKPGSWHEPHALVKRLGELTERGLAELALPTPSLLGDLLRVLGGEQISQVFLKQFRDVRADTDAIYQAVVEAPIRFLSSTLRPSLEEWSVQITPLDSHPIGAELGVLSQTTRLTFDVKMDMVAEPGSVVAP